MLAGSDRYRNPILETLPGEQLKELRLRKFRRIVSWAHERPRFHRAFYDAAGFDPDHLVMSEATIRVIEALADEVHDSRCGTGREHGRPHAVRVHRQGGPDRRRKGPA